MKKLLALVLALVMTLSLATVSTNAAFDDADNIDYTEAVEVMNAIGVLEGDGTGKFNPKGILNREQAAKIICSLLLTKDVANKLSVSEVKFADVKATDWAAPYIAYCAANGIVVGDGTNFYPKAELTGHAFAKMLLVAIGAKGNYTGADWAINVAVDVQAYGLDKGLDIVLSDKLTREEAAQMALNAARYSVNGSGWDIYDEGDKYITNVTDTMDALLYSSMGYSLVPNEGDNILSEKYDVTRTTEIPDDFGRPAVTYFDPDYDVYVQIVADAKFEYEGVNFKKNLFTSGALANYKTGETVIVYNGDPVEREKDEKGNLVAITDYIDAYDQVPGINVEIYTSGKYITKIVVTEGFFATISDKTTSKKDVTSIEATVYTGAENPVTIDAASNLTGSYNKWVYATLNAYAEDDVFVAYVNDDGDLLDVDDVETVKGTVDAKTSSYVKIDGAKTYFANAVVNKAACDLKAEGTFVLYNGYILYFSGVSTKVDVADVVYVNSTWTLSGGINEYGETVDETHYAQLIHLDGTVEVVETTKKYDLEGYFCEVKYNAATYNYVLADWDEDADNYVFAKIDADTEITKSTFNATLKNTSTTVKVRVNSETTNVITNGAKKASQLKVTTSTGVLNATAKGGWVIGKLTGKNLTAAYIFITDTDAVALAGDVVYVSKYSKGEEVLVGDKEVKCDTYTVYDLKGAEHDLFVKAGTEVNVGWYNYDTTSGITTFKAADAYSATAKSGVKNGVVLEKGDFYNYLLADMDDLDIEDALVLNFTSNVSCDDAEGLIKLLNKGWKITADIAVNNGNVVIAIRVAE